MGERKKEKKERVEVQKKEEVKTKDIKTEIKTEQEFIASESFRGARKGYAFMTGNQGLGYYRDQGFFGKHVVKDKTPCVAIAVTDFAPLLNAELAALTKVPAVSIISSIINTSIFSNRPIK